MPGQSIDPLHVGGGSVSSESAAHPLDPLSAEEIRQTAYDDDERWPCGEFLVQSEEDAGLPAWTAANRSIENTDVVVWYVFGIHHVTRPEEWPVMPVDTVSFWLEPVGFFGRNPALDVPPA
jgi:primary-amine oxidase